MARTRKETLELYAQTRIKPGNKHVPDKELVAQQRAVCVLCDDFKPGHHGMDYCTGCLTCGGKPKRILFGMPSHMSNCPKGSWKYL